MTSEEGKSKPSSNGLLGFFLVFFFFSWPSLYPILSCSHRHHFQPNYPLSLAPLAAYGNVNCSILFPLFFPSCGRSAALEEEKSRRKKRKSWQTSENKGAPLVPVTCQHYSIRYPSPPTKETLADRLIYAATRICKTKKVRKPRISSDILFTNVLRYWTLSALLNWTESVYRAIYAHTPSQSAKIAC